FQDHPSLALPASFPSRGGLRLERMLIFQVPPCLSPLRSPPLVGTIIMAIAVITGSAGLIGSEAAKHFLEQGLDVVGIDNDLRQYFFGPSASTARNRRQLEERGKSYRHYSLDIRDRD